MKAAYTLLLPGDPRASAARARGSGRRGDERRSVRVFEVQVYFVLPTACICFLMYECHRVNMYVCVNNKESMYSMCICFMD